MRRRVKRFLKKRYDAKSVGALGTWDIMKKAKRFNTLMNFRKARERQQAYRKNFANLIAENGVVQGKINKIENGYCIDDSQSLPYLQDLLADTDKIIAERGGVCKRKQKLRPFFRNLILPEDVENYPSILNFVTSSEVITTVCNYTHNVPTLSNYTPDGIRLVESNIKYDDEPQKGYRGSQLFHQDPYDYKVVYVIVALKDITQECGPFSFLSEDISNEARQKLGYREKNCKDRISDEEMYQVVDRSHLQEFCCPAGTVLFFDSSNCFHYGSRDCVMPRFMMMYALFSPCRADFDTILHRTRKEYPVQKNDSRLRKMIIRH